MRLRDDDGALVSYVGITVRDASCEGRPVRVGGIGGVKTHPASRGRGLAARGMQRADQFFREHPGIGFALLVCAPHLIDYYGPLGWREFAGRLLVRQRGQPAEFTYNRVMTFGVRAAAPQTGVIDLLGPPNRRDEAALNEALNFPHVRLASGRVTTWERRGSYRIGDFLGRAGDGWHESRWDERTVIHAGSDKVHLAVQFSRWRADGSLIGRFRSIWIVTLLDGTWGVQARSSFAV